MRHWYKPGDYNAVCDRCGFRFKASELREDWQGLRVCEADYEERHIRDFIRAKIDKIYVPWTRPEPEDAEAVAAAGGAYINGAAVNQFTLG